jgi:hypothetical protein
MKNPLQYCRWTSEWLENRKAAHAISKLNDQFSVLVAEAEKKRAWDERDRLLYDWHFEADFTLDPMFDRRANDEFRKWTTVGFAIVGLIYGFLSYRTKQKAPDPCQRNYYRSDSGECIFAFSKGTSPQTAK